MSQGTTDVEVLELVIGQDQLTKVEVLGEGVSWQVGDASLPDVEVLEAHEGRKYLGPLDRAQIVVAHLELAQVFQVSERVGRHVAQVAGGELEVLEAGEMVEGPGLDATKWVVGQIESVQVGRVVEELRVQSPDAACIQVEVKQRPAIEKVTTDLWQRVVLQLEGDEAGTVPAASKKLRH